MTQRTRRAGSFQYVQPINWTVVLIVSLVAVIVAVIGPLMWRFTAQADDTEMKFTLVWIGVFATLALLFTGLIGTMNAFSKMTLRHVQQDDADEIRKNQQQFRQLATLLVGLQQSGNGQGLDIAQLLNQLSGNGVGGPEVRDFTGDIEMGG